MLLAVRQTGRSTSSKEELRDLPAGVASTTGLSLRTRTKSSYRQGMRTLVINPAVRGARVARLRLPACTGRLRWAGRRTRLGFALGLRHVGRSAKRRLILGGRATSQPWGEGYRPTEIIIITIIIIIGRVTKRGRCS